MLENPQDFLKIDDAVRLLGVSRRTVYRWIWDGKLTASKVVGQYRIRRQDLEALLGERTSPDTDQAVEERPQRTDVPKCGHCSRATFRGLLATVKQTCGGSQIPLSVNYGASAARPDPRSIEEKRGLRRAFYFVP